MTMDAAEPVAPGTPLTADQRAMVEANAPLVAFFVNRWHKGASEEAREEHIANGMLGLIRAVQLFDPAKGFKFSTYAQNWIRQAVQRGQAVAEGIGFRQVTNWNGANGGAKTYEAWRPPTSLDRPIGDDGAHTVGDLLAGSADVEDDVLRNVEAERLQQLLVSLCRDALDLAAVEQITSGDTYADVGQRFGVTAQAVQQRRRYLTTRARHPAGRSAQRRNER